MFLGRWLLVAIVLMMSSPSTNGKGGGNCGKRGCQCPLSFLTTRVRVIFNEYTSSTMPSGYDQCGVPDRESEFPRIGGISSNDLT